VVIWPAIRNGSAGTFSTIRASGLHQGRRHRVHLSADVDIAHRVIGRRRGAVAVLTVDAEAMARDSWLSNRSANGSG
jgi:putative RNA 2'-phosphotransferase